MKRPEVALIFVIGFFIFWVYTCVAHPILGFIVGCVVFVLLVGALLFVLAALWYEKRGARAQK